jgi:hypothetical protein
MIRDLLAELGRGGSAMGVDTLARRLNTTPAAVEGALELLARKGRIVRSGATAGACEGCAAKSMCNPLIGQATRFIPVPAGARALPLLDAAATGPCAGPVAAGTPSPSSTLEVAPAG